MAASLVSPLGDLNLDVGTNAAQQELPSSIGADAGQGAGGHHSLQGALASDSHGASSFHFRGQGSALVIFSL